MDLAGKKRALVLLGRFLEQFSTEPETPDNGLKELNDRYFIPFSESIIRSYQENGWFTVPSIREALKGIVLMLQEETLDRWLSLYPALNQEPHLPKKIGVVMAGNIPMVGFHDFISVMLSGHILEAKCSAKDRLLIPLCANILTYIEPGLEGRMIFTEDKLLKPEAVIATGSNNSSRYFEYYFRNIPGIIRKNRNSIAVLDGSETQDDLVRLGKDVFSFFGLGCRNVTKIYIPDGFPPEKLMQAFDHFTDMAQHNKYANNVDYHRSVFLMNKIPFLDNGIVLLREDSPVSSPVGVVNYEKYTDIAVLSRQLEVMKNELQCIVSHIHGLGGIPAGTTQSPMPWDYADGVDTIRFLTQLQGNDI